MSEQAGPLLKILSLGEVMMELSPQAPGLWRSAFAGDTFNTAWYLAALRPQWQVSYGTRVGTDAMSEAAITAMGEAGISTRWVTRDPSRNIGLYAISTKDGERSFTYWRGQSAARGLADDADWLKQALDAADVVYLSGITLAILSPERRAVLLDLLQGRRVVFDPNIRARLWESPEAMRQAITAAATLSVIILPSFDDEAAAFRDASPEQTAARYAALGVPEVIVKNGPGQPTACLDGRVVSVPLPTRRDPVDTTGAGDSFNAAYLATRFAGGTLAEATTSGQALSARVITYPGALLPPDGLRDFILSAD